MGARRKCESDCFDQCRLAYVIATYNDIEAGG
jgi:hypothetical protein